MLKSLMNNEMLPITLLGGIALPPTDLTKLSFCGSAKPAKVQQWVEGLRATQNLQTSATLYRSLPEIARLRTAPMQRLAVLEAVRPVTQRAIEALTQDFLNQPIILPKDAQKTAIVAQALQKSMVDGYTRCIREICTQKRLKASALEGLTLALHRAISGIGLIFFRSYQLYTQVPTGLWHHLHALFQVAEYFDVLANPVNDPHLIRMRASNIQCAYIRVLMLATARLNQLNRKDVARVYEIFETWSLSVRLLPNLTQDKDNFFIVNISADLAPTYKSRFVGSEDDRVVELDFKSLVNQITKLMPGGEVDSPAETEGLSMPAGFPVTLLNHVIASWSSIAQRRQDRRTVKSSCEVCVGLVDCHYFISGAQSFDQFSQQGGASSQFGGIANTLTVGLTPLSSKPNDKTEYDRPLYRTSIQNISNGGYCLLWKGDVPNKLLAGEVLGIKELGRHTWTVGVVRWVRQLKDSSQLGIQTLASQPKPYGAAQIYGMGGYSDYMRALYIPSSKSADTPATLLTPSVPFHEQDKVRLFDGEEATTIKLNKAVFSTSTIRQFSFHPLDTPSQP